MVQLIKENFLNSLLKEELTIEKSSGPVMKDFLSLFQNYQMKRLKICDMEAMIRLKFMRHIIMP